MNTSTTIAQSLVSIGAVGFVPTKPITFKSGIISPVYVDNRRFPFYPSQWKEVIVGFGDIIKKEKLNFDVIAGIETAGIPHSASLGFLLEKPSVFIRKQVKDHGTKKRVEGGDVAGKKVLLIEDHVTTGSSSLSGVEALRAEGALVTDCLAITSYEFPENVRAFAEADVRLHTLTTFSVILKHAQKVKKISPAEKRIIEEWLLDPWSWKG